jgi:UPF0755 protein
MMDRTTLQTQKKKKPRKKKRAIFWLLMLLLFTSITFIGGVISYNYVMKNYADSNNKVALVIDPKDGVEFIINKGATSAEIAKNLMNQGFIDNENMFKLMSKINGFNGSYQSGTHILSKNLSNDEIMRILSDVPASRQVTIPEGKTFKQIVDILFEKKIIKDKEKFITTANTEEFDYDFLKDIPPRDNELEGYLFPDTYEFDMNVSDKDIMIKMLDNFDRKFKADYREKIKTLKTFKGNMTLDDVIILASIIEKEAKDPDDRYLISGVLYNRLNSKDKTLRKLQIDATIQYILLKKTGAYKDRLLYTDLEIEDMYNTYLYEGLPPGPICCPGEAAIKAALNPDDSGYLYYVARNDAEGSHEFSRTYKEHQAAIKKYSIK